MNEPVRPPSVLQMRLVVEAQQFVSVPILLADRVYDEAAAGREVHKRGNDGSPRGRGVDGDWV